MSSVTRQMFTEVRKENYRKKKARAPYVYNICLYVLAGDY